VSDRVSHSSKTTGRIKILRTLIFIFLGSKKLNVYLPSLMIEVPDHVYVFFCFLTASMSISAILVTRCAFNTIL
jgi:hypothetical protein